jgi:hypothetical protein
MILLGGLYLVSMKSCYPWTRPHKWVAFCNLISWAEPAVKMPEFRLCFSKIFITCMNISLLFIICVASLGLHFICTRWEDRTPSDNCTRGHALLEGKKSYSKCRRTYGGAARSLQPPIFSTQKFNSPRILNYVEKYIGKRQQIGQDILSFILPQISLCQIGIKISWWIQRQMYVLYKYYWIYVHQRPEESVWEVENLVRLSI